MRAKTKQPSRNLQLSSEQQLFVDCAMQRQNILVDACIGSGKTTAIQHLCNVFPRGVRILYLTYNRLLKIDAKEKIKNSNVTVTNYHGFASSCLYRVRVRAGVSDLVQTFNRIHPPVAHYDTLIIDEYQDIELELAEMLEYIKYKNPGIQIIAVGDMEQKIYDKTTLDVPKFIDSFLGEYERLEFTKCFRLSADIAEKLGRIWNKKIVGVNDACKIEMMNLLQAARFLAEQNPGDILCLGSRSGDMTTVLNVLESNFPERFNKETVYASIADNDSTGRAEPGRDTAIFTTFDSSKGLERNICVIFDYTKPYWETRIQKPQQSYTILRNIFCVAASRGKYHIIFVKTDEDMLTEEYLSMDRRPNQSVQDMDISEMFDFKYKEDVEDCYCMLSIKEIPRKDISVIDVNDTDGMIDLSPCIGIYQEAAFFDNYEIGDAIDFFFMLNRSQDFKYTEKVKKSSLEYKILFLTSLETSQDRYRRQVSIPFVSELQKATIMKRLGTVFRSDENVQVPCQIPFQTANGHKFYAEGRCDVVKDNIVYELKFVSELKHEHFLQCACYMIALGLEKGILWNVKTNSMYEIKVHDRKRFLDAVTRTVTKGLYRQYYGQIPQVRGVTQAESI